MKEDDELIKKLRELAKQNERLLEETQKRDQKEEDIQPGTPQNKDKKEEESQLKRRSRSRFSFIRDF